MKSEANPGGSSVVTFAPKKGLIEIDPGKIWLHRQFGILLRSARPAGTELGRFEVSLAYDGEPIADPVSLVWDPVGDFTQEFRNRFHLVTGDINVKGGTFVASTGKLLSDSHEQLLAAIGAGTSSFQ